MPLPADFTSVLTLLGRAFVEYHKQSGARAILVGGSVVSIFTQGAYLSGDFDCLVAADDAFDFSLSLQGFKREDRSGQIKRGWYHPSHPKYGVDSVSRAYFDGNADLQRLKVVVMGPESRLNVASIEDMIADRLGQYASAPMDKGPLRQARLLVKLAGPLDQDYLLKRVADEQGDLAALDGP